MPQLLTLGDFNLDARSGPAVWLKCAIAGVLPEVQFQGVPVVYLPGVSRAELRAIESCPRDLQPLAELQYRGVFWSQVNTKDWTVSAFLSSKNGGLGLDVAQDKATQEALAQVLSAGVLLDRPLDELKGRQINAEWLLSLLAPNPTRDLLVWMNAPQATQRTGPAYVGTCSRSGPSPTSASTRSAMAPLWLLRSWPGARASGQLWPSSIGTRTRAFRRC
jgi:hypothetical protein